jgi:hypothetical protein
VKSGGLLKFVLTWIELRSPPGNAPSRSLSPFAKGGPRGICDCRYVQTLQIPLNLPFSKGEVSGFKQAENEYFEFQQVPKAHVDF